MKTDRIIIEGYIWKSQQNGGVYNSDGICPTITCGQHCGCEPKILEYGNKQENCGGGNAKK